MLKAFESIKGLGRARLSGVFGVLAAVIGAVILLSLAYSGGDYRPLYTGHGEGDVLAVIERLKAKGVPYKVEGYMISVPDEMLSASSRYIESAGVTQAVPTGFEIFDRSGFFLPEFTQRVNYSRALSGELARTIGQINGVESARVHLVLPEKGIFGVRDMRIKTASAAVVITLRQGAAFTADQAASVAHLVAAGVPELKPDDVTVVDTAGRLLAGGYGPAGRAAMLSEKREENPVLTRKADILQGADVSNPLQPPFFKGGSAVGNGNGAQSWAYLVYIAAAVIMASGLFIWMMSRRKAAVSSDEDAARLAGEFIAAIGRLYNESGKAAEATGTGQAGAAMSEQRPAAVAAVVDIINRAPVKAIVEAFRAEHPQVIAAVLSQLSAERAAEMLDGLPQGVRADIQARASGLVSLTPSALQDIAAVLEARDVAAIVS